MVCEVGSASRPAPCTIVQDWAAITADLHCVTDTAVVCRQVASTCEAICLRTLYTYGVTQNC
eukprot:5621561-Prorocentrum_lima.AAC.1